MGFKQEAYDAEYAAIARALKTAARRRTIGHLMDAQAQTRTTPDRPEVRYRSRAPQQGIGNLDRDPVVPSHREIEGRMG